MSEDQKELIKETIKEFHNENISRSNKRVLRNTHLLLKHYKDFKDFVENAKSDIEDLDLDSYDERDQAYILSIRASRLRTLIMVGHIENSLRQLKKKSYESGNKEIYQALDFYYAKGKKCSDIAKTLGCSDRTVRRHIESAKRELSVLLFGIDGLRVII